MRICEAVLPEFDQEMSNTRKTLERIPEDKLSWKPHDKSMTLGRLAGHIVELVGWANTSITTDSLNVTMDHTNLLSPPHASRFWSSSTRVSRNREQRSRARLTNI